ncbi:unnamed protein product [Arctia plantaginis]|uniref:Peptidase S1 domain-containing protein n=1 Tax=Arctia plantaginis TaxID=874455 RepID=A0A8S0YS38_ARCPL|nr:unnamed protein product [Arctia plantaginis]
MELVKQVCSSVLVLVLSVCLVCSQSVRSPCPGIFDYERVESGIRGKIVIRPGAPTTQLVVQVNFTVTAQIFNNYYGSLNQVNERFALQNYNQGSPMVFHVNLPMMSPLPKVTAITVNGQTICRGPGDTLRPNRYLTTFSLQHTSYFQGGAQVLPPIQPYQPNGGSQDYDTQDNTYDVNSSSHPVYQPSIPAYETSRRPNPIVNQNLYYPSYEETTQRPYKPQTRPQNRPQTPPQAPIQEIPQYYPPVEEVYQTPEPVTTERVVQRPQPQSQPQTYAECGTRSSKLDKLALIYGGEDYQRGDQPWLVAIYKKSGSNLNFKCGGTLVSNRHIVTAAHCMWLGADKSAVQDMIVKLGVHRLSDWEDDIVVTRSLIDVKIHEEYDSNSFKNDISVLILSKEVKFNTYIRPACLWDGNNALEQIVGSSGVVAGWGEQSRQGGGADMPQLVRLPIVRTEKCRASKESFVELTSDKTFCAGDHNGVGPCRGDSGGGLYLLDGVRWRLRGIVSVSLRGLDGGCNLNEYVVFTDTAKYLPWINKVLSTKYYD